MRLWLLLTAVALATAQYSRETPTVLAPGKEYWYEYKSQVLTGIPALKQQYSGLKIKARLAMHVAEDKYVTMKMSSVDVLSVLDTAATAEEVVPTTWLPAGCCEPIPTEHSNIMVDSLILPIKFRYENGLVTKVYAEATDPVWSVNIKRGILSILHLDLYAAGSVTEVDPLMAARSVAPGFLEVITPDYATMAIKTGFKTIEPSVVGDCESVYSIIPEVERSELRVSKVVNYKKCVRKVVAETGFFAGIVGLAGSGGPGIKGMESMARMEAGVSGAGAGAAKETVVVPTIAADYILSGGRHDFVIKKAELTASYSLAVSRIISMDAYVKQAVSFLKAESISSPIAMTAAPVLLARGLHMTMPAAGRDWVPIVDVENEAPAHLGAAMSPAVIEAKVRMVERLLTAVVEKTEEAVTGELTELTVACVEIIKTLPATSLIEICDNLLPAVEEPEAAVPGKSVIAKKRAVLLDILPMVTSPAVPKVIAHMIKRSHVNCVRATVAIGSMTTAILPEPEVIPAYIELIKTPELANCWSAKKVAIIGAGTVGSKVSNIAAKKGVPLAEISAIIKPLIKELKMILEETREEEVKIACIKSIGNMGSPAFLSDIERIVKEKTEPLVIRTQAIYATRKMAAFIPKALKRILLPVYLDATEPTEVRVAAFVMAMDCRPGMGVIHTIAHSLEKEPNVQAAAFVYSYFQNAVKMAGCPEMRSVASMCKKVLNIIKPVRVPVMVSSKIFSWNAYSAEMKAGVFQEFAAVHKPRHVLPKVIVSKLSGLLFGSKVPVTEFGFEMAGVDGLLRKLLGPAGVLFDVLAGRVDPAEILEPLKAITKGSTVEMALNEILSKVTLPAADMEALKLGIYVKLFGNEINFFSIDKATITSIIERIMASDIVSTLASGAVLDYTRILPALDNAVLLPSPMGLPIKINYGTVNAIKIKGRVALEGASGLSGLLFSAESTKLITDINPVVYSDHWVSVGVDHHLVKVGTMAKQLLITETPVKTEVTLNKAEKKLISKVFIPKTVTPKVALYVKPWLFRHFAPVTVPDISRAHKHIATVAEINVDAIYDHRPIDVVKECKHLDMKLTIKGKKSFCPPVFFDPMTVQVSNQDYVARLEAGSSAPEALVAEIEYGERINSVRRSADSGWWFWGTENAEEEVERPVEEPLFPTFIPDEALGEAAIRKINVTLKLVGGREPTEIRAQVAMACNPAKDAQQIKTTIILPAVAPITTVKTRVVQDVILHSSRLLKALLAVPEVDDVIAKVKVSAAPVGMAAVPAFIIKVLPYKFGVDPEYPWSKAVFRSADKPLRSINLKFEAEMGAMSATECPVPAVYRALLSPVTRTVEELLLPYLYRRGPKAITSTNKIVVCTQIIPAIAKINALVALPTETVYFLGAPAPCVAPFCAPVVPAWEMANVSTVPGVFTVREADLIKEGSMVDAYGPFYAWNRETTYGCCRVAASHLETLDGAVLAWPEIAARSECDVVLAHDCSPQKLYSVMASCARVPEGEGEGVVIKKIKIIVPEKVIEISSGLTHMNEVVIKVNGAVVRPEEYAPSEMGSGLSAVRIVKKGAVCIVHCKGLGLMVETDGVTTALRASPVFRSSACGMCSHIPPYKMSSAAAFSRYALASPTCPMSAAMEPSASGACEKRERNLMISRVVDGVHKVCLSVEPREACPEFCRAEASYRASVGFHCVPASDPMARVLARESRERILSELSGKEAHIYEEVPLPVACVA